MNLLITSTSFQDSPGQHQELIKKYVGTKSITFLRGPLSEMQLLDINWNFDAIICGDDAYTKPVLERAVAGGLKVLSKYGVGLDKMDLVAAKDLNIKVRNCTGVNQATVAEHVMALLLSYYKNLPQSFAITKQGEWMRPTGQELANKKLGIIGLGRIGKEVAKRAKAFGMSLVAFDTHIDANFVKEHNLQVAESLTSGFKDCDILTLHCNLGKDNSGMLETKFFTESIKTGLILVNTARAGLVSREALTLALQKKQLQAYLADVWFEEPIKGNDPLKDFDNVWITPHIGSRTQENIEKQGVMSVENLIEEWEKL